MTAQTDPDLDALHDALTELESLVRTGEQAWLGRWRNRLAGSPYAPSGANLAAYLAFRAAAHG